MNTTHSSPGHAPRRPTRRRVIALALGGLAAVPVLRIAVLRLKDNPLPPVAEPELVLAGGWVLDSRDGGGGGATQ